MTEMENFDCSDEYIGIRIGNEFCSERPVLKGNENE